MRGTLRAVGGLALMLSASLGACRENGVEPQPRLRPAAPAHSVHGSAFAGMFAIEVIAPAASGADMNDAGDVIGTSYNDPGCGPFCLATQETVVWRGGTRIVLPSAPGLSGIYVQSINASGQIAGIAGIPGTTTHAVVWTPSGAGYTARDLGALPGMSTTTVAGIDNLGRVVGWSSTGGAIPTASAPYMWSLAGGMVNLRSLGFPNDIPLAVSPGGTVATSAGSYVLGTPSSATPNPAPPSGFAGITTYSTDINDAGDQARLLPTTAGQSLRYMFRLPHGGTWQMLSASPSGNLSAAEVGSINDAMDIAGTITGNAIVADGPTGVARPLLNLISPAYGITALSGAGGMNASGQLLAAVYIGQSARLAKLTPTTPCLSNCIVASALTLTSQFVQDPLLPGSCVQGGKMYNQSSVAITLTTESGAPLANVSLRGRFMDDYWTNNQVTGTTNAAGVVTLSQKGLCGVGAIAFVIDGATIAGRTLDRTRGTLAASVIPSITPPTNQPPVAAFTYSCTALTCSFNGSSSSDDVGIVSWLWKGPNGATWSTAPTFNRTFAAPTTVNVTLQVTDGGGLSSTVTRQVIVPAATNQAPVARWTYACTAAHVCTFDGRSSTDADGSIVSYVWKRANGVTLGSGATITSTFPKKAKLDLTLTVTDNGGLTGTRTKAVVVP